MTNGWLIYYLIPLAGVCSLTLPILLRLFSRSSRSGVAPRSRGSRIESSRQMNSRFFMALNAGTGLILQALILIPCMAIFGAVLSQGERAEVWRVLVIFLLLCLVLMTGLFYALKKGDLDWLD